MLEVEEDDFGFCGTEGKFGAPSLVTRLSSTIDIESIGKGKLSKQDDRSDQCESTTHSERRVEVD